MVKHGESRDDFFLGKGKKVLEIKGKEKNELRTSESDINPSQDMCDNEHIV